MLYWASWYVLTYTIIFVFIKILYLIIHIPNIQFMCIWLLGVFFCVESAIHIPNTLWYRSRNTCYYLENQLSIFNIMMVYSQKWGWELYNCIGTIQFWDHDVVKYFCFYENYALSYSHRELQIGLTLSRPLPLGSSGCTWPTALLLVFCAPINLQSVFAFV